MASDDFNLVSSEPKKLVWISKGDKRSARGNAGSRLQSSASRRAGDKASTTSEPEKTGQVKGAAPAETAIDRFKEMLTVLQRFSSCLCFTQLGPKANGSSIPSFRNLDGKKTVKWNHEEWGKTRNLAEQAGEKMQQMAAEQDLEGEDLVRAMLDMVVDAAQHAGSDSAWMSLGALVETVVDGGTEQLDEDEMCQVGALFLELAMAEGCKSRAGHEMVAVLQAMAFLREPLEKVQHIEGQQEVAVQLAEACSGAGLFISAMCQAPSPHRMLRSSANQQNLKFYEGELKQLALKIYAQCFDILVSSRALPGEPLFVVPYLQNPEFCGREGVLEEMAKILQGKGGRRGVESRGAQASKVRVVILTGPSGIGKTEIAVEFTYRQKDNYDGILWVDARSDVLEYNYVLLKACLGIQVPESHSLGMKVEEVRLGLEGGQRFLLVLDGLEGEQVAQRLDRLLPKAGQSHVLVTAANSIGQFSELRVSSFDEEEAWLLLTKSVQVSPDDSSAVEEIAELLFFHPLGLQAAAYVLRAGQSPQTLLQQLHKIDGWNPLEGEASSEGVFTRPSRLQAVLKAWLDRLCAARDSEASLAAAMLDVAGWFGPQAIPLPLLSCAAHFLLGRADGVGIPSAPSAALLVNTGVVQRAGDSDALLFPPLLQAFARSRGRASGASKAVLATMLAARCFDKTTLHFAAVWARRNIYEARRDTMGRVWSIATSLASYWVRTQQRSAALTLCDEILDLGYRAEDARGECLFWKAYLLGAGKGAKLEEVDKAAALLGQDEIRVRLETEPDAFSLLVKTHKLHLAILQGSKGPDEVSGEIAELETDLAAQAELIPPRDVTGPLGDYSAVSAEGRFLAHALSDLASLLGGEGLPFSAGGYKWLTRALQIQHTCLTFSNRVLPLFDSANLPMYSNAASLYFQAYEGAMVQQHFHDCFRAVLSPKEGPSSMPDSPVRPNPTPSAPVVSSNPLHRTAFSDEPPPDFSDTDSDSDSGSEEEDEANGARMSGSEANLPGGVGPGRGVGVGSPGSSDLRIAANGKKLEQKWGYGCRPQWLPAVGTFGSVHFTAERQLEACRVFTTVIQLARSAGDPLLEAQAFTRWALAEPDSEHTVALLEHCRGGLIRQLQLLPSNPRLCIDEKHTLRILLAQLYWRLARRSTGAASGRTQSGGRDKGTEAANGGLRVAKHGGAAGPGEWAGLVDEGRGMEDPKLTPAQKAVQYLRNCLSIAERSSPDYVALYSYVLGLCLIQLDKDEEALTCFKRSLSVLEGRRKQVSAVSLGQLASAHWLLKKPDAAKECLEKARKLLEQEKGDTRLLLADVEDALGRVHAVQGQLDMALEALSHSRTLRLEALGPKHPALAFTLADMAMVQEDLGRADEASMLRLSALAELGGYTEADLTALREHLQSSVAVQVGAALQFYKDKKPNAPKT